MITDNDAKSLTKKWLEVLSTDEDNLTSELGRLIFGLSSSKQKLEEDLLDDPDEGLLTSRKDLCLTLVTSSLTANGMRLLADLEGIPSDLITMIPKANLLGRYMPHQMVAVLVLVKQYLYLRHFHPSLPAIKDVTRLQLYGYLSSWSSVKGKGLLPCVETIAFDGSSESWPAFRIERKGILIKHGIRGLFFCAKADAKALPEHLFFKSLWLERVL